MSNKVSEYEMLREEILQYLEEYQSVRNMMYAITVTILGIAATQNATVYMYLFPLIVILPSYIIATDYWKGVVKASTYLVVFHEQVNNSSFKWETRHAKLNNRYIFMSRHNYHFIPYFVCTIACIILYFLSIDWSVKNILLGVFASLLSALVFKKYRKVNRERYILEWKKIKNEEDSKTTFIKDDD